MEYSIGFFGGLGMAYGTLTSAWPLVEGEKNKASNLVPMLLLLVFIPFVLWQQSFINKTLDFLIELGGDENTKLVIPGYKLRYYSCCRSNHVFKILQDDVYLSIGERLFSLFTSVHIHSLAFWPLAF